MMLNTAETEEEDQITLIEFRAQPQTSRIELYFI